MLWTILGYLGFGVLVTTGVPWTWLRAKALWLLHRGLYGLALGVMSLFAMYGVQPKLAAPELVSFLKPVTTGLLALLPATLTREFPGAPWLVYAFGTAVLTAPVLSFLDAALAQLKLPDILKRLEQQASNAARPPANNGTAPKDAGGNARGRERSPRLFGDYLKK